MSFTSCQGWLVLNSQHHKSVPVSCSVCEERHHNVWILTLVLKPKTRLVLRMVAVEVNRGLMGGGKKGGGDILATESPNHCACIEGPVAYFKEIMVGLCGEVEELNVCSWGKKGEMKVSKERHHLPTAPVPRLSHPNWFNQPYKL